MEMYVILGKAGCGNSDPSGAVLRFERRLHVRGKGHAKEKQRRTCADQLLSTAITLFSPLRPMPKETEGIHCQRAKE